MLNQHEHEDDRAKTAGHNVEEGEIKTFRFAMPSQESPNLLTRFSRKDSQ